MLSVSYAGKTSEVLRGGALGANGGYVLAHCAMLDRVKVGHKLHELSDIWDESLHTKLSLERLKF